MKAIQVSKNGGPEALAFVGNSHSKPKPNEIVMKVSAIGVNFIDVYFREGRYPAPLPLFSGQEASGVVTEVGADVEIVPNRETALHPSTLPGAYAEYAPVGADRLVRVPNENTEQQSSAA